MISIYTIRTIVFASGTLLVAVSAEPASAQSSFASYEQCMQQRKSLADQARDTGDRAWSIVLMLPSASFTSTESNALYDESSKLWDMADSVKCVMDKEKAKNADDPLKRVRDLARKGLGKTNPVVKAIIKDNIRRVEERKAEIVSTFATTSEKIARSEPEAAPSAPSRSPGFAVVPSPAAPVYRQDDGDAERRRQDRAERRLEREMDRAERESERQANRERRQRAEQDRRRASEERRVRMRDTDMENFRKRYPGTQRVSPTVGVQRRGGCRVDSPGCG